VLNQATHWAGAQLNLVEVAPGALAVDQLVLEQPDCGLGQRVIERVADRPDGGVDAFVEEAAGQRHRRVLTGFNRSMHHRLVQLRVVAR
jgi:hypothetical protein